MVLRVLKLLMRPFFGVPTPLANVAFVVAVYFRWQDLSQIAGLATLTLLGRDGAQCRLCDTVLLFAMKEVKVNKLKGGIDCRTVCFGLGGRCEDTCKTVKAALSNSTSAPCQAAGFCPHQTGEEECRWSYKAMGCLPAGGVCRHRLPTTCELAPGVRRWRQAQRFVQEDIEALGAAFAKRAKYCSEPNAGPRCIRDAAGLGRACQFGGYVVIAVLGTYLTVRAIESPGGADDRQWLVFWLLMFAFAFVERFTDLLLSHIPRYYELKLGFLLWLMFSPPGGGAEKLYRVLRRRLGLGHLFGRHFARVARSDADYLRRLPLALQREVWSREGVSGASAGGGALRPVLSAGDAPTNGAPGAKFGASGANGALRSVASVDSGGSSGCGGCGGCGGSAGAEGGALRAVLSELCTSEAAIVARFGRPTMKALWTHWNAVDPTVVVVKVVRAVGLPVMDPVGASSGFAAAAELAAEVSTEANGSSSSSSDRYPPGTRVRHIFRGNGTVTDLMGDGRSRVKFDNGDERRYQRSSMRSQRWSRTEPHALVDAYVIATLVPPSPPEDALSPPPPLLLSPSASPSPPPSDAPTAPVTVLQPRWFASLLAARSKAAQRPLWHRVRLFVRCLTLVVRWRRCATSVAAAKEALARGAPTLALRRLWRVLSLRLHGRTSADSLRGGSDGGILSTAFHGGPSGPKGQYSRRATAVRRGTNAPKWHQTLELPLPSRTIGSDGTLSGDTVAPLTRLRLEAWDADVLSRDDFIGEVTIPLTPAMDGRVHRFTLPLTDPEGAFAGLRGGGGGALQPLGELTVEVSLES
tara:strand:+ start:106 stop:2529 length:2424 start_codon:yes stop_codon:yes gene_type:complete